MCSYQAIKKYWDFLKYVLGKSIFPPYSLDLSIAEFYVESIDIE